jgi:hypothetical protein
MPLNSLSLNVNENDHMLPLFFFSYISLFLFLSILNQKKKNSLSTLFFFFFLVSLCLTLFFFNYYYYFFFSEDDDSPTGRTTLPEKLVCVVGDRDLGVKLHSRPNLTGNPWKIGSNLPFFSSFLNSLETLCWPDVNFGLNFMGEEGERKLFLFFWIESLC